MTGDDDREAATLLTTGRRRIEHQTMPRDWQVMACAYLPALLYALLRTQGRTAGWPKLAAFARSRRVGPVGRPVPRSAAVISR